VCNSFPGKVPINWSVEAVEGTEHRLVENAEHDCHVSD
jgi:hypothetical protein